MDLCLVDGHGTGKFVNLKAHMELVTVRFKYNHLYIYLFVSWNNSMDWCNKQTDGDTKQLLDTKQIITPWWCIVEGGLWSGLPWWLELPMLVVPEFPGPEPAWWLWCWCGPRVGCIGALGAVWGLETVSGWAVIGLEPLFSNRSAFIISTIAWDAFKFKTELSEFSFTWCQNGKSF